MLVCNQVLRAGTWDAGCAADTIVLDFDGRHRRRHAMTASGGTAFLLDLDKPTRLRDGDGLVLSDSHIVAVQAARESLMEIGARDSAALLRIAFHLGNRHLPTQLLHDRLLVRHDSVIAGMVHHLGGTVTAREGAFDPEPGAFAHPSDGHEHATSPTAASEGHECRG